MAGNLDSIRVKFFLAILGIQATCATAQTVGAGDLPQAEGNQGLDEVVVTAQRREQRLQEVPIAITAFSGEGLREAGIQNTDQLASFTPNLTWNQSGSVGSNVGLRGIVDSNITTNQVASVGIVADEVSLNSPVLNTIPLFDIERVEVLRGPQVTLYGRSTTAGAVNLSSRKPKIGDGLIGYVDVSYGNYEALGVEAAVGTDLGETAAIRLSMLHQSRDGVYYNPTLKQDVSDRDRQAYRLSLTFQPSDALTISANLQYGRDRSGGPYFKSAGQRLPSTPSAACTLTTSSPGVDNCVNDMLFKDSADFDQVFANELSRQHIDLQGGVLNVRYNFGGVSLSSITSYLKNEFELSYDVDGGPLTRGLITNDTVTDQISQEVRLYSSADAARSTNWIVGAYYFEEQQDGVFSLAIREPAAAGTPPGNMFRSFAWDQDDQIKSVYAQFDWEFAPRWELSLGGRYSDETKSGIGTSRWSVNPGFFATNPDVPVAGTPTWNAIRGTFPVGTFFSRQLIKTQLNANLVGSTPFGKTWTDFGGKIGLKRRINDDAMIYASYSRGFKGGTFNLLPAVRLTNPAIKSRFMQGVEPETLDTVEVGFKYDLPENNLRLNGAVFWNDYKDQQQTVFDPASNALALANAANATIKGLELEVEWRPTAGLLIQSGLGLLDATYGDFIATPNAPLSDFSGQRVIQSSKTSWNGLARHTWSMGGGEFSVQGSFKHFTPYAYVAENIAVGTYSPLVLAPATTLVDARAAYRFANWAGLEVAAWGKNLTDERLCTTNGSTPFGSGQCGPNEPQTYGLSVRMDF